MTSIMLRLKSNQLSLSFWCHVHAIHKSWDFKAFKVLVSFFSSRGYNLRVCWIIIFKSRLITHSSKPMDGCNLRTWWNFDEQASEWGIGEENLFIKIIKQQFWRCSCWWTFCRNQPSAELFMLMNLLEIWKREIEKFTILEVLLLEKYANV